MNKEDPSVKSGENASVEISEASSNVRTEDGRSKTRAGIRLCYWTMGIIAGFLLLTVVFGFVSECRFQNRMDRITDAVLISSGDKPQISALGNNKLEELLKPVSETRCDEVEKYYENNKTVLINFLLPIMTTILGYVFGSGIGKDS